MCICIIEIHYYIFVLWREEYDYEVNLNHHGLQLFFIKTD